MFLKTSNGYLINTNIIESIYITAPANDFMFYRVVAKTNTHEVSLYRDTEQQHCQHYLEDLTNKIAVKMW